MRTSFAFISVLVSYCCCNKLLTKISYLKVLEVRSLKWVSWDLNQGVGRTVFLLEALWENLISCLFELLKSICIPWLLAPSLHLQSQQPYIL